MSRAQTTAQLLNSVTMGSAKIEMRAYGSTGAYTDLGLASNIQVTETITPAELTPDNASPITVDLKEHSVTIKFDMLEQNLTNIYALRGGASGLDTYATQAASPVTVTDEEHVLTGTAPAGMVAVPLTYKNGDGTIVTSITVKDHDDTSAVLGTDYTLSLGSDGYTYIARISSSTVLTDGDTAKVSYTYTPLANKSLSSGGKSTIGYLEVKLTNLKSISGSDKAKTILVYKTQVQTGLDYKFPAGDSTDPLSYPVELKGYDDATRTAGDQLYKIVDEQGV
jgi:Rieske Fe-S protein